MTLVNTTGMNRTEALAAQYGDEPTWCGRKPRTITTLSGRVVTDHRPRRRTTGRVVVHVLSTDTLAAMAHGGITTAAAIADPTTRHGVTFVTPAEITGILREDGGSWGKDGTPVTDRVAARHRAAMVAAR